MDGELSGPVGVDIGTPPGASEIGQPIGHSNLYVKNLPPEADEPALWQLFSQCGTIEAGMSCKIRASRYRAAAQICHDDALNESLGVFAPTVCCSHALSVPVHQLALLQRGSAAL